MPLLLSPFDGMIWLSESCSIAHKFIHPRTWMCERHCSLHVGTELVTESHVDVASLSREVCAPLLQPAASLLTLLFLGSSTCVEAALLPTL